MAPSRLLRIRNSTLVMALVGLIIAQPRLEEEGVGRFVLATLVAAVLCVAIYTVSTDRKHLRTALGLGIPTIVGGLVATSHHALGTQWSNVLQLIFFGYVIARLLGYLLRPGVVDLEKLCAAAAVYLLLGLAFSILYKLVELRHPGSFTTPTHAPPEHGELLYFSYVTLTTLGYGDLAPAHPYARSFAGLEAMTGTFFMAVLVARLVSLYRDRVDQRA